MLKFLSLLFLQFLRMKIIKFFFLFLGGFFAKDYDLEVKILPDYSENSAIFFISSPKNQNESIFFTAFLSDDFDDSFANENRVVTNRQLNESIQNEIKGVKKQIYQYEFINKDDYLRISSRAFKDNVRNFDISFIIRSAEEARRMKDKVKIKLDLYFDSTFMKKIKTESYFSFSDTLDIISLNTFDNKKIIKDSDGVYYSDFIEIKANNSELFNMSIVYENLKGLIQRDFVEIDRHKPLFEKKREYLQEIQDKKREFNKEKTIYDRSWIIILSVVSSMLFLFFAILLIKYIYTIKRT